MLPFITNPYTLAVFAALLPVFVLLIYIYVQDKKDPEPVRLLFKGVFFGILSALLVILVVGLLQPLALLGLSADTPVGAFAQAFLEAAIPEECAKCLMLWLLLRKNRYFDQRLDGIVYAVCVGMGFAGFENILYLISNLDSLAVVGTMRGIFSVPGHFFFAVAMGYYVSLARFSRNFFKRGYYRILTLLVPIVLHVIYDAILMVSNVYDGGTLSIVFGSAFFVFCFFLQRTGRRRIRRFKA